LTPQTKINGALTLKTPFEMANGSEYYKAWMEGLREDLGDIRTELVGLRSNLNQLGNQMTRIEALDLHARLQQATSKIETLEKDKARYEGQILSFRWIASIAGFISVIVGLIVLIKGLK
jgi:DNA repair exonuclease SbcCD ATPase subunit